MYNELFECRVRFERTLENGMVRKVTESYLVEAISFSEAETRIAEEMSAILAEDFEVVSVVKRHYSETLLQNSSDADTWFKAKVNFIQLDEKTGAEKKTAALWLIKAKDFYMAERVLDKAIKEMMSDVTIVSLQEMPYVDYYECVDPENKTEQA